MSRMVQSEGSAIRPRGPRSWPQQLRLASAAGTGTAALDCPVHQVRAYRPRLRKKRSSVSKCEGARCAVGSPLKQLTSECLRPQQLLNDVSRSR